MGVGVGDTAVPLTVGGQTQPWPLAQPLPLHTAPQAARHPCGTHSIPGTQLGTNPTLRSVGSVARPRRPAVFKW